MVVIEWISNFRPLLKNILIFFKVNTRTSSTPNNSYRLSPSSPVKSSTPYHFNFYNGGGANTATGPGNCNSNGSSQTSNQFLAAAAAAVAAAGISPPAPTPTPANNFIISHSPSGNLNLNINSNSNNQPAFFEPPPAVSAQPPAQSPSPVFNNLLASSCGGYEDEFIGGGFGTEYFGNSDEMNQQQLDEDNFLNYELNNTNGSGSGGSSNSRSSNRKSLSFLKYFKIFGKSSLKEYVYYNQILEYFK